MNIVENYVEQKLRKMEERKIFNWYNSQALSASGTWDNSVCNLNWYPGPSVYISLFNPSLGNGNTDRTGNTCMLESIEINGCITVPAKSGLAAPPPAFKVRVFISEYLNTNGSFVLAGLIATNTSSTDYVDTMYNINRIGTAAYILWDEEYLFSNIAFQQVTGGTYATPGCFQRIHLYKKFDSPRKVEFYTGASTANVADINNKSYWIHMNASDVTLTPSIALISRCIFTDCQS